MQDHTLRHSTCFGLSSHSINKTGNPEPWETVEPTKPQKVMCTNNIVSTNSIYFKHNNFV